MSIGNSALTGSAKTMGAQAGKLLLQVVGLAVLSRILGPADFGLVATLAAVVALGELLRDFGLTTAAIQAPSLSHQQKSNLFYLNVLIGVALALSLFLSHDLVAYWFGDERLSSIAMVTSAVFVLNSLQVQSQVELTRQLRFGALALTDLSASFIGLMAAIVSAALGAGYWALVLQTIAAAVALLVQRVLIARWLPGLPRRRSGLRQLVSYGGYLGAANLLQYAATYADTYVIAARYGAEPLGFYNRAFQLLMVPLGQILAPLTNVALPLLMKLGPGRERYFRAVLAAQAVTGFFGALLFPLLAVSAPWLVAVLLGPGWEPTAPVLSLLSVAGLFNILTFNGYWVFLSTGRTGSLLAYNAVTKSFSVICILVGSAWGITGVAAGFAVGMIAAWPICTLWLGKSAGLPVAEFLRGGGRVIVLASLTAASAVLVTKVFDPSSALVGLALATTGCIVGFTIGLAAFARQEVKAAVLFLRRRSREND